MPSALRLPRSGEEENIVRLDFQSLISISNGHSCFHGMDTLAPPENDFSKLGDVGSASNSHLGFG